MSTFDADADGWLTGEFFGSVTGASPTFVASGGNPGGYLQTGDVFGWHAFVAPNEFLGDLSAAIGGTLFLDERIQSSDGVDYPMVVISDGTTRLQFRTTPPGTDWTSYAIPLEASAGWEIANPTGSPGTPASDAEFLAVLSSLTSLRIDADWLTGGDTVSLDNVCIETAGGGCSAAVPEPATRLLLGLGLTGLAFSRRRLPEQD